MSIWQLFHGGGKRRRSTENWNDLERKVSDAEARAKRVKGAVLNHCPTRAHGDFWVHTSEPQPCPWCEIGQLRERIQLLTTRPAPRPGGIAVQAPADGSRIAAPADEPATDVNAETQAVRQVDLDDTQLVPKVVLDEATGMGDTMQIPAMPTVPPIVPVVPLQDAEPLKVTWGVDAKDSEAEPSRDDAELVEAS